MVDVRNLFQSLPRRYRHYPYLVIFVCSLILVVYVRRSYLSQEDIIDGDTPRDGDGYFDLFDDDDFFLVCPPEVKFNISNRRHLAVIVAPKLLSFVWKNFVALLCTGVDAYIMLDEVFLINSSLRNDGYEARSNRSIRSYTYRFLHVSNKELDKYGVSYMIKFPSTQYTSWERAIVWLYHRNYLTTVWLLDYGVHWYHVQNITYLFDLYTSDKTDILCADIVPTAADFWQQWPKTQSDIFPKSYWIGTYSPLVRWSRPLLLHHYEYMQLMHTNRLQYEIHKDFRFQEFIMGTIANIEGLSIATYNKNSQFTEIGLGHHTDQNILSLLRIGKHIIHPIRGESILTKYRFEQIADMVQRNSINLQ
jgi:hypothetical protein